MAVLPMRYVSGGDLPEAFAPKGIVRAFQRMEAT